MMSAPDMTMREGRSETPDPDQGWVARWFGRLSFRTKLLLLISLVASVALSFFGFAVLISDYLDMRTDAIRNVSVLAEVVGANSTAPLSFDDRDSARDLLQSLRAEPLFQFARLTSEEGEILAISGEVPPGIIDYGSGGCLSMPHFQGRHLTIIHPVLLDGELLGTLTLTYNLTPEYLDLARKGIVLLGLIIAAWIIAFILSSRIQRILARPVLHLSEIARQISTGQSYFLRAEKFNEDELGELTDSFNDMLDLIQLRDTALEQARIELEDRVRKRTGELDRANFVLNEEIEERARIEVELRRAKVTAEESTRSKSEFLANMSHEIRTPMTAILGYSDLLLDPDQTEKQRTECIQTIRRNGEHLLGLINDILDISKIEAGKMTVEHIRCSPVEILSDVVSLMRVRAEGKGLSLDIEYAFPIPEQIESDPIRLRQILINLLGNAIKFTESGGVRLILRCDKPRAGESVIRFEVVDTGIGLTPEHLQHIFQPFTQADNSTIRKYGGTGLGLTISKRLAELLGGDITIDSTPGEGSSFMLSIRFKYLDGVPRVTELREPAQNQAKPVPSRDAVSLSAVKILLAEDGPDNQRLISFLLRKAGAVVEVAANGRIAYERAISAEQAGEPFAVILMDMQMPVMDGYEATEQLRREGYAGPIIALTAHAMAGDREKCIQAGCDDYTTKPIKREVLLQIIQTNLPERPESTQIETRHAS